MKTYKVFCRSAKGKLSYELIEALSVENATNHILAFCRELGVKGTQIVKVEEFVSPTSDPKANERMIRAALRKF